MEASSMGNLGALFQIQGKKVEVGNLFADALKLNKETGKKLRIASDFTALGSLFSEEKDFDKAKKYQDSKLKRKLLGIN